LLRVTLLRRTFLFAGTPSVKGGAGIRV